MDNSLLIQKQIKDNAEDLQNYVRDLQLWEEEMKRKDRQLSKEQPEELLPPVRRPKLSSKSSVKQEVKNETLKKRIPSYDYKSWENFDVEKACKEVEDENNKNKNEEESDEENAVKEEKYLKEKALYDKELGNKHVKAGKWDEAIDCYTKAIAAYPRDPVFFANRALCFLRKKRYEAVESDCTESLKLDGTYVKAMLRRAAAREALGRLEDAKHDLRCAIRLEPNNSQAHHDLNRLQNLKDTKKSSENFSQETTSKAKEETVSPPKISILEKAIPSQYVTEKQNTQNQSASNKSDGDSSNTREPEWEPSNNTIQPIFKPPHLRSKKSLKRIEIYDVGPNTQPHVTKNLSKPEKDTASPTPPPKSSSIEEIQAPTATASAAKPRSIWTMSTPVKSVPPPPSTSVQFHKAWDSLKSEPQLCFRFLKQIPGDDFPNIFKESLESGMFSSIVKTLASEFIAMDEPVFSYLRGLSKVRRFSTLALFMSSSDKSNLLKLFDHCLSKGECSSEEIAELRRVYEMG